MFVNVLQESDPAHFHDMARKCRQLASLTTDPRALQSLHKLAQEYDKAAEAALANGGGHMGADRPFRRPPDGNAP